MASDGGVVSVQTSAERGGGEYANVDMLEALRRRGARVTLLTDQPGLASGTAVPTRRVELGPKLSRRSRGRVALAFAPSLVRLARALRRERPEVLIVHYKKEQLMAALLPGAITGAVVWAEWGPLPEPLARGPARRVYARAARRAKAVLAVSEETRHSIVTAGVPAEMVTVIPPVIDPMEVRFDASARERLRREWGLGSEAFVVGCVSRLHPSKPNELVVDALGRLPDDAVLVVAGEGDAEAALRRRARPLGDRARFLPTPRGWVAQLLSACDVQVVAPGPSEGTPRAAVFGQLAERPVISTSATGVADLIAPGCGAITSPADDADALARCLAAYRSDAERRAREGRTGRRRALERFDYERALDAVERVLRGAREEGARC